MNALTRSGIRYAVDIPQYAEDADAAIAWCHEQYGEPGFKERWMCLEYTIQFRDKRDRDWFFLRWGDAAGSR